MEQWKVFRKITNNKYTFKLSRYDHDMNYSELIKSEKNNGFRQVIINSQMMIKLVDVLLNKDDFVLREIVFNEMVNEEYKEEISSLVNNIKKRDGTTLILLERLLWCAEKESIDIEKMKYSYRKNNEYLDIMIVCNGIISGKNPKQFYDDYLNNFLIESFSDNE